MPHFVQDVEEIRQRARQKIEDGAVTSSYELDKDKAVEILNEALATEIVCVLRYMHHYFMATGVHGAAARDEFKEHADDERDHADRIAERIQQLGGKPDYNPKSLLQRSVSHYVEGENLAEMIREDLVAERVVIDVYREMIKFFGEKDSTTRKMLEDIQKDEEEHASDLSDLMFIVNPSTGETAEQDPGTEIGENDDEERTDRGRQKRGQANGSSRRSAATSERDEDQEIDTSEFEGSAQPARGNTRMGKEPYMESNERGGLRDRGESRPARATGDERPGATRGGVQPAHAPGTTGRVMARRGRNNVAAAEDDVAIGGQTGTSKSAKIVNKDRKRNRAA